MRRKIRSTTTFSLSFLDIMSCGLGAAVLIFLLLKHVVDGPTTPQDPRTLSEIDLLEEEIDFGEDKLARIRNTISDVSDETVVAQGRAREIKDEIDELEALLGDLLDDAPESREGLKAKLSDLESKKALLEQSAPAGNKAYEFTGDGQRQYLTGLRMTGDNVLILLDASASMLDSTIVNIVRRRRLADEVQRNSPKWLRARDIAQWVVANLPITSDFQLLVFNKDVSPIVSDEINEWFSVRNKLAVAKAVQGLASIKPQHGTDLQKIMETAMRMNPRPDNIFLITDGLPTLSKDS
ncbi:MAG: VWA domain-containing protein, partial [Pseudomonadota bacterium]